MLLRKPPTWMPDFARARAGSQTEVTWPDARVDALIETYVEWWEECAVLERAYERWTDSERADGRLAYAAYRAALDREEKAAAAYQVAVAQLVDAARKPTEC